MKRIMIIAAALLALGLGWLLLRGKTPKVSYTELHPQRGDLAIEFRETGTVSPRNRLEIKPPVQGRVESVLVREGQRVKKGDIIAWLSSSDRAALLDAALSQGPDEYKRWEDVYKPTPITAPLDGFIIVRGKEPGQTVGTSDALLVMADTLIIEALVDETDLRYISVGQRVSAFLDAYPDAKFAGVVEHIAYESEVVNNVTVYTVKIRPVRPPRTFRAGMTATIEVRTTPKRDILTLPVEAVTTSGGAQTVLVRSQGPAPEKRTVETGITNGKRIEITAGLSESDTVLIAARNGDGAGERKKRGQRMGIPGMGGGRR